MEDMGYPCWHPSGVQSLFHCNPGGIAHCRGLNHRLMALNPPGSSLITVSLMPLQPIFWRFCSFASLRLCVSHLHSISRKAAKPPRSLFPLQHLPGFVMEKQPGNALCSQPKQALTTLPLPCPCPSAWVCGKYRPMKTLGDSSVVTATQFSLTRETMPV